MTSSHPAVEPQSFPWLDPSIYSFALGIEAGGATWLSGQTSSAFDGSLGRVVCVGDGVEQARTAWEKVAAVADASAHPLGECSELVEYLTAEGLIQRDGIEAARPVDLRASTVVVESLVRPTAVVEIEVVTGATEGLVRLPQIMPVSDSGEVAHPGDFVGQCRWVLEEAARMLAAHGLDLSHVVRTVQQTTPATRSEYRATSRARRELLGPVFPASTGLLVSALAHPDPAVLVALDVWASSLPKSVVNPGWDAFDLLTFTPATRAGDVLFISGTTAWDAETNNNVAPDDVGAQAEFVYGQIAKVCEAAGGSLEDLVKTIEYITPPAVAGYREVSAVRESMMGRPLPASTGVVVHSLLSKEWLIEVEAVAVLR
jgi:enamine deaminase RidA (YjgF/YER057c/UK114 family)